MSGTDKNKVLFKEEIELEVKSFKDIISEIDFKTEEEALVCESIIHSLEKYAADNLKKDKAVQLPYIGVVRKNIVKREFLKSRSELKTLRKQNDKETYREIVRQKVLDLKKKQKELDDKKLQINKLITTYKKEYEYYYKHVGPAYANMFIFGKTLFKEVPFDKEVQKMYDELSKKNKE